MTDSRRRMLAYVLLAVTVAMALTGLRTVLSRLEAQNRAHAAQERQGELDRADIKRLLSTQADLLAQVKATTEAAQAALDLVKDCTTPGGECYRRGQARTAEAVAEIVTRVNAALSRLGDVSAQNAELRAQITRLAAEAAQLRAAVERQAQNPQNPVPPPSTPLLCQLVRC